MGISKTIAAVIVAAGVSFSAIGAASADGFEFGFGFDGVDIGFDQDGVQVGFSDGPASFGFGVDYDDFDDDDDDDDDWD